MAARRSFARHANWTVGLAAAVLVLISAGGYFYHREQLAAIATEHLRLIVTGPSSLQAGLSAEYTIYTTAIDDRPLPAEIEVLLLAPNGERLKAFREAADEHGRLKVVIPAEVELPPLIRLRVVAWHRGSREEAEAALAVEPDRRDTRLTLDRPLYRPGETVYFRSQTLSHFRLAADRERQVRFEIVAPGGAVVPGSSFEAVTRRGVAGGDFTIPNELPNGLYALRVRGDETFPAAREEFFVRRNGAFRLKKELEFFRDDYGSGERVVADFKVRRVEGGVAAGAKLRIVAEVDGQILFEKDARASDAGTFRVDFRLPERIERGDGQLTVAVDDGNTRETIAKTIPIDLGKIDVTFHPEGGNLVAGLENRVYFVARTRSGEPLRLSGEIVGNDSASGNRRRVVASVETVHEGMGSFTFIPRAKETYRLIITAPPGLTVEPKLPKPSSEHNVVLTAGEGVFDAGAALKFHVRSVKAGRPLVAAAYCRGAQVGQQWLTTEANGAAGRPVVIDPDDAVGGVIRLVLYDYGETPPRRLAERLVYRRPGRRLKVEAVGAERQFSPGESVELSLSATDEKGQPVPAALGVSVAELDKFSGRRHVGPERTAVADVPSAAKLPANQVALTELDEEKTSAELDLLLVTRDWRRFDLRPPLMYDNVEQIKSNYEKCLADYQADRTGILNTLTAASFFGGLGLVLAVAMLGLMRIVSGIHLWVSAVGATTCCMILGAILMDPGRLAPDRGAGVAFASYVGQPPPAVLGDSAQPRAAVLHFGIGSKSDFAETAFWRPLLIAGPDGKAAIRFDLPKEATTFLVSVDAHGAGRVGSGRAKIVSRLPFGLQARLPSELTAGDRVDLPLEVVNNTDHRLPVELYVEHGERIELDGPAQRRIELAGGRRRREFFVLNAIHRSGDDALTIRGTAGQLTDAVVRPLRIVPSGFPKRMTYGGRIDGRRELVVTLPDNWAPGSLEATLAAFPSVLAELRQWLEGSLRGPDGGCRQALASNYCAAMIARLLAERNVIDPDLLRRVKEQLAEGHRRLARYECRGGGFDHFGGETGDMPLTAFALMQLRHARQVFRIDPAMVQRTVEWLLARRDGKGRFQPDANAPSEASGAFIVWALSESGQTGIEAEMRQTIELGKKSDDPYVVALAAATAFNAGINDDARRLLEKLAAAQADDGHVDAAPGEVETTALAALAWQKSPDFAPQAQKAVEWIAGHRPSAGFGPPRASILALKAVVEQTRGDGGAPNAGKLIVRRDGMTIGQYGFSAGVREKIAIDGLETNLKAGENRLTIELTGDNKMSYTLSVEYHSLRPENNDASSLRLTTKLDKSKLKAGETVALTAELQNVTERRQPMAVAVVGLPAGLRPQVDRLEELKKAGAMDHYEIRSREVVLFRRRLAPKQRIEVRLDLEAAVPGRYVGPPSRTYLYSAPAQRQWCDPLSVEITRHAP